MTDINRDGLIDRLLALDEEAALTFTKPWDMKVVIVGGSALVLMNYISRSTRDIDVLSYPNILQEMLQSYDINGQVKAYADNFPLNYEDRLVPINIPTKVIRFYTASLEDIVIAKLCSVRPTDRADVTSPDVIEKLDWDLLRKLATSDDEVKANMLSERRYDEFLYAYEEYERRYRPCEN